MAIHSAPMFHACQRTRTNAVARFIEKIATASGVAINDATTTLTDSASGASMVDASRGG